jgi:glycine cleavage system H protein
MTDTDKPQTLFYKRSHFGTHLPIDYCYSPSHFWLARQGEGVWRVGFTKFATRMLGEMVDHGFETEEGAAVQLGQTLGWVEGFKAISDLFSVVEGQFLGGNPILKQRLSAIDKEPYGAGWLYAIKGALDPKCVDVHGYVQILDRTIDRLLEKQRAEGSE